MGNKRYTADEKKSGNQSACDSCHSVSSGGDRSVAIKGYLKLALLLLAVTVVVLFRSFVMDRIIVSGESMLPTYSDGDVLWAKKFDLDPLERNQVVTVSVDGKTYIKRVIGLPNETVQVVDGKVYINGNELEQDVGYQTNNYGCAADEVHLQGNEYFLMGDNRDNSVDSREWGAVNINEIESVIFFQIFPFSEIGFTE